MVQTVSRRHRIAESRVRSKASLCKIFGGRTNIGADFSYLCLRVALVRTNGERLETFQKCCFGNRGSLDIKYFHLTLKD
jgi:hypothetical protein